MVLDFLIDFIVWALYSLLSADSMKSVPYISACIATKRIQVCFGC